jgi:Flp pilus assembly protein TadG
MLKGLVRDERGHVLIMFTVMLPVIFGLIGLSLEGGRLMLLHSQLQDMADAAALAGARELDGGANAISRARQAALDWSLKNAPWWSNVPLVGNQIGEPLITDTLDGAASVNDAKATYVKVTTVMRSVAPIFLVAVTNVLGSVNATATASSKYVACNVQPMMLCNPFEPQGKSFTTAVADGTVKTGMQFHMKVLNDPGANGSNQSYAPGDFGLLDPPGMDSSGANSIRNNISQQSPNFCYINQVSPRTGGAVQKVNDGINVRFDIPNNGNTAGLDQSPAPDVLKGYQLAANYCNNSTKFTDLGADWRMPRDTPPRTPYGNLEIGNGTLLNPDTYWGNHFGGTWPSGKTRYQAYLQEMNTTVLAGTEARGPTCQPLTTESTADRRIINMAVVDCVANNVRGNSTTNLTSSAYVDFFITEPSTSGDVWTEFVRIMTPTSPGTKLHQIVQLVRDQ